MKLTSEQGRKIREEYSETKENEICLQLGLKQIGGPKTKIDGLNDKVKVSIKNFTGASTQVHLTTKKQFDKQLGLDENSKKFIELFCGCDTLNYKNRDRYFINEIDSIYVDSFLKFLNNNKIKIIDLMVKNSFDITNIIYRDLKTNTIYNIKYDDLITKIAQCNWVAKKGGIHLKNENGKTYFHIQREGKKNKNNRYNVLCHIHRNLFI